MLAAGCFVNNEGQPPPQDAVYYPTALLISPGETTLYVTNSDFDLQYNGGTILALDLKELRARYRPLAEALAAGGNLTGACAAFLGFPKDRVPNPKDVINDSVILFPGPCKQLDISDAANKPNPFVRAVATTGAFISGAALVHRPKPDHGARLFVPVRGDPSVTFLDVTDDRDFDPKANIPPSFTLECRGSGAEHRCSSANRIGLDPFDNTRQLSLPVEPVGIAASEDGTALVVAHQTQRTVSLTVNRWPDPNNPLSRPTLEFLLGGVPTGPEEVATVPAPAIIAALKAKAKQAQTPPPSYAPGFLVTYAAASAVDLFRFQDDAGSAPPRPFLTRVFEAPISTSADGKDSRGLVVDASGRQACERDCQAPAGQAELDCLRTCTDIPLRLYVANRAPAALLTGKIETTLVEDEQGNITGAFDVPSIQDTVPLTFGASKVAVGTVIGQDGKPATRVFAAAFDSRFVFSYDPVAHRVDAVIRTGRGPHALVVDEDLKNPDPTQRHPFLIVGHFTDSYMGVVDLDMRSPDTFGTMFAAIGKPTPPKESK